MKAVTFPRRCPIDPNWHVSPAPSLRRSPTTTTAHTVDADGAGRLPAMTSHTVYEGNHAWTDFDESGNVLARYLFGTDVDKGNPANGEEDHVHVSDGSALNSAGT